MSETLKIPDDLFALPVARPGAEDALEIPEGILEPPPSPLAKPAAEPTARLPKMVGSSLLKGLTALPGLPGDIAYGKDWLLTRLLMDAPKNVARYFRDMEPTYTPVRPPEERWGTSAAIQKPMREEGLIDNPALAPRDFGERVLARTAEGVGGTAPLAALNPIAALPMLLGGAGGGATGEAARTAAEGSGYEAPAELIGNLVGGVAGSGIGNLAQRGMNMASGMVPEAVARYERAGVTPRMVGDVTGTPLAQKVQEAAKGMPVGGGVVQRAAEKMSAEFEQSVDDLVGRLGGARDATQAGQTIQTAANRWVQEWSTASRDAWNRLYTAVPKDAPVMGNQTGAALNSIRDEMIDAPKSLKAVMPDIEAWAQRLASDSAATGGALRFETVKNIRSKVGGYLNNPEISGGPAEGWLKKLYGALSEDMRAVARAQGAEPLFDEANAITSAGKKYVKKVIEPVLGRPNAPKAPEEAYRWLKGQERLGGTRIERATNPPSNLPRNLSPDELDEVAGFRLREAASPNPSGDQSRAVNMNSFLTEMGSSGGKAKISDAAKAALYSPETRKLLEDLAYVANRSRGTFNAAGNTSRTAMTKTMQDALSLNLPAAGLGYWAGQTPGAAGMLALSSAVPYLAAKGVTSPRIARLMATPGAFPQGSYAPLLAPAIPQLSLESQ